MKLLFLLVVAAVGANTDEKSTQHWNHKLGSWLCEAPHRTNAEEHCLLPSTADAKAEIERGVELGEEAESDADAGEPDKAPLVRSTQANPIILGEKEGDEGNQNANRRRRSYSSSLHGGCPSSTDKDTWIKAVQVTTVSRDLVTTKFSGRSAASTIRNIGIFQLAVSTVDDAKAKGNDYGEDYSKGEYPGTASAMLLHNHVVEKYNQGDYTHNKDKNIDDGDDDIKLNGGSLTRDVWWKLGTDCYAMASYSEIKQNSNDEFKNGSGSNFANAINLRLAKLSVCKNDECAEKKIVMDCWVEDTSGTWEQCTHWTDEAFIASVLARG